MALTTYCELNEVRAALGVNDIELPDTVLNLPVYEIGLVRELNKVSTSLPVAFSTSSAILQASRTAVQQALVDATHLFSVYACARQVGVSLGSIVPKDIGDGKATISRFSDSPYKDVMQRVESMYLACKAGLLETLDLYNGTTTVVAATTPATFFKASARAYDPVTGA
jgi:hypothetical protein